MTQLDSRDNPRGHGADGKIAYEHLRNRGREVLSCIEVCVTTVVAVESSTSERIIGFRRVELGRSERIRMDAMKQRPSAQFGDDRLARAYRRRGSQREPPSAPAH